jgi:hypothetical protein
MVGRNVGLSVRGISGQTDRYRAQRDRYKLSGLRPMAMQGTSTDSIPPRQVVRMGAARQAGA